VFRNREEIRQRIMEIVEKFRQKGATNPEKALSASELGLPPRFEQAMHRRLGQTGIFVEVNGKYFLNEERLKQIQEQRARGGVGGGGGGNYSRGGSPTWMRAVGIFLMLPIGLIVAVALFYFVGFRGGGYFPGEFLIIFLVIALGLFAARMIFWRSRRRYWGG
jgi:hypothetical protein